MDLYGFISIYINLYVFICIYLIRFAQSAGLFVLLLLLCRSRCFFLGFCLCGGVFFFFTLLDDCGPLFGVSGAHCGVILASWGLILESFWRLGGSLWHPFGKFGLCLAPRGAQKAPRGRQKTTQGTPRALQGASDIILSAFGSHFELQNGPKTMKKRKKTTTAT